ncbi:hypothetical protein EVAR_2212_1 [Eumeta japonica]|uniref:Uncharacterized protein n=1 Tax=Eumeta variegata TaxID=151549 RepID=A0A4C1SG63_EUMVA|nr:hypothetical protein EVAR_2212_1 [Eumeta japonica]
MQPPSARRPFSLQRLVRDQVIINEYLLRPFRTDFCASRLVEKQVPCALESTKLLRLEDSAKLTQCVTALQAHELTHRALFSTAHVHASCELICKLIFWPRPIALHWTAFINAVLIAVVQIPHRFRPDSKTWPRGEITFENFSIVNAMHVGARNFTDFVAALIPFRCTDTGTSTVDLMYRAQ